MSRGSGLLTDDGKIVETVSCGVAFVRPVGDTDSDGDWDATESAAISGSYDIRRVAWLSRVWHLYEAGSQQLNTAERCRWVNFPQVQSFGRERRSRIRTVGVLRSMDAIGPHIESSPARR